MRHAFLRRGGAIGRIQPHPLKQLAVRGRAYQTPIPVRGTKETVWSTLTGASGAQRASAANDGSTLGMMPGRRRASL